METCDCELPKLRACIKYKPLNIKMRLSLGTNIVTYLPSGCPVLSACYF